MNECFKKYVENASSLQVLSSLIDDKQEYKITDFVVVKGIAIYLKKFNQIMELYAKMERALKTKYKQKALEIVNDEKNGRMLTNFLNDELNEEALLLKDEMVPEDIIPEPFTLKEEVLKTLKLSPTVLLGLSELGLTQLE